MRSQLISIAAALVLSLPASGQPAAPAAPAQRGLPPEAFGHMPGIQAASLSPDGTKIAFFTYTGDQPKALIVDAGTRSVLASIGIPKTQEKFGTRFLNIPSLLAWVGNDRLLVGSNLLWRAYGAYDDAGESCSMVLVNVDGSGQTQVLPEYSINGCTLLAREGPEPNTFLVNGGKPDKGGSMLARRAIGSSDVLMVDKATGRGRLIEKGESGTRGFLLDSAGKIRARLDVTANYGYQVVARLPGSEEYQLVYSGRQTTFDAEGQKRAESLGFLALAEDPDKAFVSRRDGDKRTIALYNMRTRAVESTLLSDPKFDASGVLRVKGRVVGTSIIREKYEMNYLAEDWRQLKQVIKDSFPGDEVRVMSSSNDLKRHILYLIGPDSPSGEYLLLDLATGEAKSIGHPYPALKKGTVVSPKWVTYKSRDGVDVPAYLTMPASAPNGKSLAAIVMPHGGPAARDDGEFDWWSQYYANLGYVVLQPQFRGSTGFGRAWAKAGEQQWGLRMQDDVSDGVKYLIDQGIADAKRICILGWSYGGYAAGAGATLTPDLYRCAVAGAGVFDLIEMLNYEEGPPGTWERLNSSHAYWKSHIGKADSDREKLIAASPAMQAANVKAPIMIIHGDLDTTVPKKQSQIFADALKAAGKPYEFVLLKNENHNISFYETRLEMLRKSGEFLLKHNPP